MVVLAVLACLRETRPGLTHEAKGQPDFPGRSTALTETAKRFCGFARSTGRHADSGFAVSRRLGVNSPFLSSNACAMTGDLLLKNAVDASAVAFWRNRDNRARVGLRFNVSRRSGRTAMWLPFPRRTTFQRFAAMSVGARCRSPVRAGQRSTFRDDEVGDETASFEPAKRPES
jgi:hypothetical protein